MFIGKKYPVCLSITFSSSKRIQGKMTETRSWKFYLFFPLFLFPEVFFFCILGHLEPFLCVVMFNLQLK